MYVYMYIYLVGGVTSSRSSFRGALHLRADPQKQHQIKEHVETGILIWTGGCSLCLVVNLGLSSPADS